MDRFFRTERLIGKEALARIRQSMVTVVGLGAVGGYAVEGLARAGVGHLRLVDFDRIRTHNINRQIIALDQTVGMKKTEALGERLRGINPNCQVELLDLFADRDSIPGILTPRPHLLVDAIEAISSTIELLSVAATMGLPTISSMGAALRTDFGCIRVADIFESRNCPMAKRMRKKLRQRGVGPGITCVYSEEAVNFTFEEPEEEEEGVVPAFDRGRKRRVLGSLPTITGIFGLIIANLAIQRLSASGGLRSY